VYEPLFEVFEEAYASLVPVYDRLAALG